MQVVLRLLLRLKLQVQPHLLTARGRRLVALSTVRHGPGVFLPLSVCPLAFGRWGIVASFARLILDLFVVHDLLRDGFVLGWLHLASRSVVFLFGGPAVPLAKRLLLAPQQALCLPQSLRQCPIASPSDASLDERGRGMPTAHIPTPLGLPPPLGRLDPRGGPLPPRRLNVVGASLRHRLFRRRDLHLTRLLFRGRTRPVSRCLFAWLRLRLLGFRRLLRLLLRLLR